MPKLNIPPRNRDGLSKLLSLDPNSFDGFVAALERQSPSIKLIPRLSAVVDAPDVNRGDLEKIILAVRALYMVRASAEVPLDTFVRDVSEAIEAFDPAGQSEQAKDRLRRVLSVDSLISSSKALTLLTDHERTLHATKILTDVRHVFRPEPESEPYGAVIVHVLKLTCHEADRDRDFYVALDGDDIANLRTVLDRAEAKAKALRGKLALAGIVYLGGADRSGGD